MKAFTSAVAVVVLTFINIQESAALPLTGAQEPEEAVSDEGAEEEETSVETWMMPYDIREKTYGGPLRCQLCCGCCVPDVCGMCCE
ncbi:hepcidin-like [Echeneis naucrates]|uniref:hepcidin-like n=1 Tax=Echeneis naucrates TaxID=173247 RepID=UPI00111414B4|nr:hepcidin-like [Echeneis naucrates]